MNKQKLLTIGLMILITGFLLILFYYVDGRSLNILSVLIAVFPSILIFVGTT